MRAEEYAWEKKRLILSDENVHQREELAWKAMRLLLTKK